MSAIGRAYLDLHLAFRPVDGTFMGRRDCDARLPRADRSAAADEQRAIAALRHEATEAPETTAGERLDKRIASAELQVAAAAPRTRYANPAWYSGEAVFAILGLLLPQSTPLAAAALQARLAALPDFLADGRTRLREAGAAPRGWVARAQREAAVLAQFLRTDLAAFTSGIAGDGVAVSDAATLSGAAMALERYAADLAALPDRDPAVGAQFLDLIVREQHGLEGTGGLLAAATAAFERLGRELDEDAARLTPGQSWQEAIAALGTDTPAPDGVLAAYRHWHERATSVADAAGLVTPERAYGLDYRLLAAPFRRIAPETYFLFYRSPPALRPGAGSVYWVSAPGEDVGAYLRTQSHSVLKTTHTVHHGSIGHHTQNARARGAPGVLAPVAGTDCASGIALLSAGTMVEGWACYAEDLLREAGGFFAGAELLLLKQNERRNAASVLVDIKLHRGEWTLAEAERFYRDEAGFPPSRVAAEVNRNSMFPGSRLMYWAGVEAIKTLRRASPLDARRFHDGLLGHGHVPIAAAAAELARVGRGG
jgi:hypothetical protein